MLVGDSLLVTTQGCACPLVKSELQRTTSRKLDLTTTKRQVCRFIFDFFQGFQHEMHAFFVAIVVHFPHLVSRCCTSQLHLYDAWSRDRWVQWLHMF